MPELRRRACKLTAAANASPERHADAGLVEARVAGGSVDRRLDRSRAGDEHGDAGLRERGLRLRKAEQLPGRLRQNGVDPLTAAELEEVLGEERAAARRHPLERVAESAAHRPLARVAAGEPQRPLAVLSQRSHERGGPGRATGRHEDA